MWRPLLLFNEKADKLQGLSFTKRLLEDGKIGLAWNQDEGLSRTGPTDEEIEALILTLRFFVQDNEPISIRRMAEHYETLPVAEDTKQLVRNARVSINEFLDSPSIIQVRGKKLTNRYVFDIFLYGGLAHANEDKKTVFDKWAADHHLYLTLQMTFTAVLSELLRLIFWWRNLNTRILKEAEGEPGAAS